MGSLRSREPRWKKAPYPHLLGLFLVILAMLSYLLFFLVLRDKGLSLILLFSKVGGFFFLVLCLC